MNKKKVLECMEKIVDVGRENKYEPEIFKSAIDGVKLLIEDKIKENEKKMIEVVMFTKNDCPNCKRAKFMFKSCPVDVEIIERNIEKDSKANDYLKDLGVMSVPSFLINGKMIEGFNEGKIMEELGL